MNTQPDTTTPEPPAEKWIGSGEAHFVRHLHIHENGVHLEGVQIQVADEPIRVVKLHKDIHIAYLPVYVDHVEASRLMDAEEVVTYTRPPDDELDRRRADNKARSISATDPDIDQRVEEATRRFALDSAEADLQRLRNLAEVPDLYDRIKPDTDAADCF